MKEKYKQHTAVVDLDTILHSWSKEFTMKDGSEIMGVDHYVDTIKNKAVFVIRTRSNDD